MNGARSIRRILTVATVGATALLLGAGVAAAAVRPAVITVNMSSYGATCNGTHNDQPALDAAVTAVRNAGGGTVIVPAGNCRIVQTAGHIYTSLSTPVTIQGSSTTASSSTLSLATDDVNGYRELFDISGSNVVLKNLTISRPSNAYAVFLDVVAGSGFKLTNVVIDGHQNTVNGNEIHGVKLTPAAGATISTSSFSKVTIKNTLFGLFEANGSPGTVGTVNGFTVDQSTFTGNYDDDLEFNSPYGSMANVTVTNSAFSNNRFSDPADYAGKGVGFANVQTGKIQNNTFSGYKFDPIHIEDRSSHITVDHNQISNAFTTALDFASHVFIVNDVHYVTISNNTFDTSANTNAIACIYASPGGAGLTAPSNITVTGNTFKLRPNATDTADYTSDGMAKSNNTYVSLP